MHDRVAPRKSATAASRPKAAAASPMNESTAALQVSMAKVFARLGSALHAAFAAG